MNVLFVYFNKDYRPRTLLSLSVIETIVKNTGHRFGIVDILDISKQTSGGANNIMWISKTSNESLLRDFR